jgi:hypothetical protein
MKPLAQFRRFLGREFSLLLPPNFHARFFIPDDLKKKKKKKNVAMGLMHKQGKKQQMRHHVSKQLSRLQDAVCKGTRAHKSMTSAKVSVNPVIQHLLEWRTESPRGSVQCTKMEERKSSVMVRAL